MSGMKRALRKDIKFANVKNFWGDPVKTAAYEAKLKERLSKPAVPLFDRVCKLCGCPLHFAKNSGSGARLPLDLRAHIYCIVYDRTAPGQETTVVRTELCYVSHFFTCPFADQFSASFTEINKDGETKEIGKPAA